MRTTHATALTCAALATAAAHAGTPTVARWAAPASGAFFTPSNWVDGVLPNSTTHAIIDAVGAPYTIENLGVTMPFLPSLTLDSADATLSITPSSGFTGNWSTGNIDVRAGVLQFARHVIRSAPDRSFLIGESGTLRVPGNGLSGSSANRLVFTHGLSLFSNEGLVELGRNTELAAIPGVVGAPQTTLVNAVTGRIQADAITSILAGTIINEGAMVFTGRPDSSTPNPPKTVIAGSVATFGPRRTVFNHSGSITLQDAAVEIVGSVESTGLFAVDKTSALTLTTRITPDDGLGSIRLNPGTRFKGGGTVTIQSNDITGDILADNDLRIHGTLVGSIINAGATTLRGYNENEPFSGELSDLISAGRLTIRPSQVGLTIHNDVEAHAGLSQSGGLLRFGRDLRLGANSTGGSGDITVGRDAYLEMDAGLGGFRSLTVAENLILGEGATLSGSFATIGADLILGKDASVASAIVVNRNLHAVSLDGAATLTVLGDAIINGDASVRSLRVDGVTAVNGNLTTTQGTTTLNDGSVITGTLAASSTSIAGSVAIGSFATAPSTTITLDGELTLTADTSLTTSRLILAPLPGISNDFTSRIHADVTLTRPANQVVPSFQSSVLFAADLARTLEVDGHMSLTGRLSLTYFTLNDAAFGQSFTLIHATDGLTGQFDPLSLPSLASGLSLELVYDTHSLTLRVVPTPAAAPILALASLAAARRRRA